MGIFDIVDDITKKQVMKTDTGDNRIFGVVIGLVAKNYDENMPGRVCVTVPTRDENANELKWARVAMPFGGSAWGHYFLPEAGDQVLLAFEQGNIEKPYVIGCVPKDSDKIIKKSVDENNQYKKIVTKNGNTIYFEDNKEGDGKKDKIKIMTAGEQHKIELDNENKVILISDEKGKNLIKMKTAGDQTTGDQTAGDQTGSGQMEITAEKKLTIKVGDKIELTLNGSNGTVQLKATDLKIETSNNLSIKSSSSIKAEAATVSMEANGSMKLESGGSMSIKGNPINQ